LTKVHIGDNTLLIYPNGNVFIQGESNPILNIKVSALRIVLYTPEDIGGLHIATIDLPCKSKLLGVTDIELVQDALLVWTKWGKTVVKR